jgi:four helix bundle protein
MRFIAHELALEIIRQLRPLVQLIRRHDSKLTNQTRDAASSIALNLAEGNKRQGRDRRHHWTIASGSAEEVRSALQVAEAWGYLEQRQTTDALQTIDQLQRILWKLTR